MNRKRLAWMSAGLVILLLTLLLIAGPREIRETTLLGKSRGIAERGEGRAPEPGSTDSGAPVQDRPEAPAPIRPDPFADARVISSRDTHRADGRIERVRIIKATFKYPLLRVVETVVRGPVRGSEEVLTRLEMVADHIIVRLRQGVREEDLQALAIKYGATIRKKLSGRGMYLMALPAADLDSVPQAIDQFAKEAAALAYAEPDYIAHATITTPNDPRLSELWGLNNTGQTGGTLDADIDAPEAWDLATGSRSVVVGVIDTGVDYAHEDLAANIWANPGEIAGNGIDDDGNGFVDDVRGWNFVYNSNDPKDDHFHGTHVAGTIGAVGNNGKGVVGVCWQVTLVPVKFLDAGGSGTFSDAIDAIYYCTGIGTHLTSNSWGGGGFSQALKDAIDDSDLHGILFVAAAGNDSADTDVIVNYPSAYTSANIIAVAAMTHADGLASFSNYGLSSVDLGAPGSNIVSTFPMVPTAAMQSRGLPALYGSISGTSMATPHVSGVCALLKSALPNFSHAEIKSQVFSRTDPLAALSGKCVTGGRLNVFRTLQFSTQPVLSYKESAVDDASGNADGIINPGERIGLQVTLRNLGSTAATGVTATLALVSADPQVTLVQTSASFGTVPALGTATSTGQYLFDVAAACPTPHPINFHLTIQDAASTIWTSTFTLTVDLSYSISGTVRLDGAPLAAATLEWTGPSSGSRVTGSGGTYSFGGLAGTYTLIARKSGYVETNAINVSVPPARTGIDFAFTSVTISGRVKDSASGIGIGGATVNHTGAITGATTTLADGSYSISAVVGRSVGVTLTASKPGVYFDSLPVSVTLPPSAANVDFLLPGAPDIAVSPLTFDVTANLGETPTRTLTLGNVLSGPLTYSFENHVSEFAVGERGDILRVLLIPGHGIAFDGSALWTSHYLTPILDRVDPVDGFLIGQLDLTGIVQRPWALSWDGINLWVADQAALKIFCIDVAARTVVRSFNSPEGLVPAGIDVVGNALYVYVYRTIYKLDPVTGQTLARIPVPLELNVNDITLYNGAFWCASNTGDVYKVSATDGSILASVRGPDGGSGGVRQLWGIKKDGKGSLWVASQNGLYLVATGELEWLRETPDRGTVAASGSQNVTVTFDSVAIGYGVHKASIHVKSNDPDEPNVRVPVTFTVLNASNRAPVAQDQSITLGTDAERAITLTATDLDGNPLTYALITKPLHGLLTGAAPNVLYSPFPGYTGSDVFTFKANDGYVDSNVGTITLSISGNPDIQVAPASVSVAANPGEVVTRTLTVSNTGTRKLTARLWNQTSSGGANPVTPGAVLRTLSISGLFPSYSSVHPEIGPLGVAFDGAALWVSGVSNWQRPESVLFKLDPVSGQVLGTLDLKGTCDPEQLAWDGANLWATNFTARKIYCLDLRTGALVTSFTMPAPDQGGPTDNKPRGLVRVGNTLHVIGEWTHPWYRSYWIYLLDANTGALIAKYRIPNETLGGPSNGTEPFGLAYFNGSLWFPSFTTGMAGTVFEMNPADGTVRGTFAASDNLLMGMTSDCERGLWVASRTSRKLYLLDSGELGWLRAQPRDVTVDPGGSATITLTIDSMASGAGNHAADLHIESNDSDERDTVVPVTLSLSNQAPVADAGADQIVPEDSPGAGGTVYLNGYGSRDPDGTLVSYLWKEGANTIASGPNPGLIFAAGTRVITLTVTDNNGATATDSVTITVGPLPSGAVHAWGTNGWNQLGDGTNINRLTPVPVSGAFNATAIGAGGLFSVGLKPDQSLWAWGDNWFGQIGDGTNTRRSTPVAVSGMTTVRSFSTGYTHTLAVKRDRTVWAWGQNDYGQLGDGTVVGRNAPVQVTGLSDVKTVAGGWYHSLALRADGTVWAWGSNQFGQLGDGTLTQRLTPVLVTGLSSVTAIAAGGYHSLAIKSDGTLWAWGSDGNGQRGQDPAPNLPTQVTALSGVKAIACGFTHSVVLLWDGTVWSFGYNNWGQLGDGTNIERPLPVQVTSLTGITAISTGFAHSGALKSNGTLWCWGRGTDGDLGDGTTSDRFTPVQVSTISGGWGIVASKGSHTLSFVSSGTTYSISGTITQGGSAFSGAVVSTGARSATTDATGFYSIGNVPNGTYTLTATKPGFVFTPSGWSNPVVVSGANVSGRNFTAAAGSGGSGFALAASGAAWSWGSGYYGQLGDGRSGFGFGGTDYITSPVSITGLAAPPDATAIAGGADHSLARKSDGSVWSWGRNLYGQLGDGSGIDRASPVWITSLTGIVAVSAGANHSVALKADGTVCTWGRNNLGQLGDGTTSDRSSPVQIPGLATVVAVAAGADHTLAVRADGTVWAWGSNGSGRLGEGTTVNRNLPVQVPGVSGVLSVSAGMSHSLALKSDGTVWAWGNNFAGQLGIASKNDSLVPVRITALSNVVAVAAGLNHSLALLGDGSVWTWGFNTGGSLPDGLSMAVPPTVGEGGFIYNVQLYLSSALAQDLVISLQSSDPTRVIVPPSATIPAGVTNSSFELRTVDNSLQEGVKKVVISATSSLGTITANTFVVDDETFVTQGIDLTSPKQVTGIAGVVAIAAGGHSMALKSDGTLWTWGFNQKGALGDGTVTDRAAPVQVPSLTGMGAIAAGWYHSLALSRVTSPYQQDPGADGLIVLESENYHAKVDQGAHSWTRATALGYSGSGSLEATPNNGTNVNAGWATGSPRLDFQVNFVKTGTHHIWIRGIGPTGSDDSCHAGLDGQETATSDRISTFGTGWTWSKATMDGPVATFDVLSAGLHTVNLWMREDGFILDKILITTNAAYAPSGSGPIETPRFNAPPSVSITSPANGATYASPATIPINASASDTDGTITKVEFFQGSTKLGESTTSPYSFTWSGVAAGTYSLTAKASDSGGATTTSGAVSITVTAPAGTGTILREWWTGITGTSVSNLTSHANYPNSPSGANQPTLFEAPVNWADNYGTRMRGYVHPPVSGSYVFWIASDDSSELWLSSDANPANRVKIASVTGWTNSREWTKYASQQSALISLVAGNKYFVEALQKEGGGGDNLAVGWQLPDATQERPIPGNRLSPFDPGSPVVTVAATDGTASETAPDSGQFTVTRTGSTASALVVNITLGGSAANGVDYTSIPSTATIPAGQGSTAVAVTPIDDASVEGSETVVLTVASGSGYVPGSPSSATVTITDNDSAPKTALFVVGNATLPPADQAIQSRLQGLGYMVTVKSAVSSVTGDATGKTIVVVSSTIASGDVNTKFRTVAVPVLNWEQAVLDDFGMTAAQGGVNTGTIASQTAVAITNPSHPMAAGLSGTQTVCTSSQLFSWGKPGANGVTIATVAGDATKTLIFGYLSGASMPGLVAPARRVHFFLENTAASVLTAQGWQLFDAAVAWAVGTGATSLGAVSSDASIRLKGQEYATLQDAIDAAKPGEWVELGAGTFYVPGGLTLRGGVSLRGVAPHRTIVHGQGAATVLLAGGTPVDGRSVIEFLTVTGGVTGLDTGTAAVLLRNLQIVKNAGHGVITGQQGGVEGVSLTIADNGGDGLRANNTSAFFRGLIVARNAGAGVSGVEPSFSTFFGNGSGLNNFSGTIPFLAADGLDYREAAGSVSVDAGDPGDAFDQEPAPQGGRINQGAFGNSPDATHSAPRP